MYDAEFLATLEEGGASSTKSSPEAVEKTLTPTTGSHGSHSSNSSTASPVPHGEETGNDAPEAPTRTPSLVTCYVDGRELSVADTLPTLLGVGLPDTETSPEKLPDKETPPADSEDEEPFVI